MGAHYSAYNNPPFDPPKFMPIPHARYIHPIPTSPNISTHYNITPMSQVSSTSQQLKSPQSHHVKYLNQTWVRLWVKIHPETHSLPSETLYNSRNKSYLPKIKVWDGHRITIIDILIQKRRTLKGKTCDQSQVILKCSWANNNRFPDLDLILYSLWLHILAAEWFFSSLERLRISKIIKPWFLFT